LWARSGHGFWVKGIDYPVMRTVFRVSSALDMANEDLLDSSSGDVAYFV
jgi:hypothetical protein